ncbi:MAG: DNA-packaging protein [Oscillospiraceae bacterium]|nr:DNA-packaging protein [Oscillospiraceae bacterium]
MNRKNSPNFKSTDELKELIDSYFKDCEGIQAVDDECAPMFDKNGAPVMAVPEKPPTVSGLALALGFQSRLGLLEYKGREVYRKTKPIVEGTKAFLY